MHFINNLFTEDSVCLPALIPRLIVKFHRVIGFKAEEIAYVKRFTEYGQGRRTRPNK